MSLDARNFIVTEQWGKDCDTVIPPIPVSGRSYRNSALTPARAAGGQAYDSIWESAGHNQKDYETTGIAKQCGKLGWPVWSPFEDYVEGSVQLGTDAVPYRCKEPHGPNTEAPDTPGTFIGPINPVTSPNKDAYWQKLSEYIKESAGSLAIAGEEPIYITTTADGQIINVRTATTSRAGVVKKSTDAMAAAGEDDECYITPRHLAAQTQGLFTRMVTLTTSGTFTAPHDGVYKVTLIGGGGGGGKGGGANGGGTGGAAGGATSFASFGTAAGGGGGGGGGDACGGGGGGAGIIVTIYVWLTAGQQVAYSIGAGGAGASVMNSASTGQSAGGNYGGAGNMRNGGGLGGTGGGTGGSGTSNVPGRSCGGGGTGASNGTLFGGGGGGGGGAYGAEFTNTFSATAGPGAAKGSPGNDANGGNGGAGGNGAIIIEYA